jgi:hypothetical protein
MTNTTPPGKVQAAYEVGAEVRDFAGKHGIEIDMDLVEARLSELAGVSYEGTYIWACAKVANRWTTKRFALDASLTPSSTAAPASHRAPEPAAAPEPVLVPVIEEVVETRVVVEEVVVPVELEPTGTCQKCGETTFLLAHGAVAYHTTGRRRQACAGWGRPAAA